MCSVMRKSGFFFAYAKNKDQVQLHGNITADQYLCFSYTHSKIPLHPKSENSNLLPFPVAVQPGLCQIWSETLKTGFLMMRLIYNGKSLVPAFLVLTSKSTATGQNFT